MRPRKKSERELLERIVEQGDESYAQQGRTLALLDAIRKELKNMPVTNEQIEEALGRIEGNTDNIRTFMETTSTEIAALRAEIERLTQAGGLTAEQEETLLARLNTIDEAQDAALTPPAPPTE